MRTLWPACGTAPDPVSDATRAEAARLAVADQSIDAAGVRVAHAPAGARCAAAGGWTPTLAPGEAFSLCVTVAVRSPLLPEFVDAHTATGRFLVERDRYVDG